MDDPRHCPFHRAVRPPQNSAAENRQQQKAKTQRLSRLLAALREHKQKTRRAIFPSQETKSRNGFSEVFGSVQLKLFACE
jgi:hypothetical protein